MKYKSSEFEPHMMKRTVELMEKAILKSMEDIVEVENSTSEEGIEHVLLHEKPEHPQGLKHNAGGVYNFALFLPILKPPEPKIPLPTQESLLGKHIALTWDGETFFDSFSKMYDEMNKKAAQLQGPGWLFLTYNMKRDRLYICAMQIHDNPLCYAKESVLRIPIFAWNLWEHAYYSQYEYRRNAYIKSLWFIMNWSVIENRFQLIKSTDTPSVLTIEQLQI